MQPRYWIAAFFLIVFQYPSQGHGVQGSVEAGAVGVRFVYDGGAPLRAADVTATSLAPGESSVIQGLTDRNGRFAFFPDQTGEWRVEVNDGMGHRAHLLVDVGENRIDVAAHGYSHTHHLEGWVIGVAVLFGLFGIWGLWRCRQYPISPKQD